MMNEKKEISSHVFVAKVMNCMSERNQKSYEWTPYFCIGLGGGEGAFGLERLSMDAESVSTKRSAIVGAYREDLEAIYTGERTRFESRSERRLRVFTKN